MANLKKINSDIRRAKASKKVAPKKVEPPVPVVDWEPLVTAIKEMQQPVVKIEAREPVSYRITVDINSRGDMVGALMEPVRG